MSRWYRRYAGTVSDPKIAEAALIAEVSKAIVIATWDMILESAADANDGGKFRATSRNVAATLGEQPETIGRVFQALQTLEMISSDMVSAWAKRQYQSDSSTERSRKHRALKKANGNATEMQRCATPPESESDTEEETERDNNIVCHSEAAREAGPTDDPNFVKCKRELNGSTERIIDVVRNADGPYGTKLKAAEWVADSIEDYGGAAVLSAFKFLERCVAEGQKIRDPKAFIAKNARRDAENAKASSVTAAEAKKKAAIRSFMTRY